jgi:integrase/recombinase XerD
LTEITWERFPHITVSPVGRRWLTEQSNLQLSPKTVLVYARALEDYLSFGAINNLNAEEATREHIGLWVRDLSSRENQLPNRRHRQKDTLGLGLPPGLSNATIQQRLTAVRLFYDYLIEAGVRRVNPVGRGHRSGVLAVPGERRGGMVRQVKRLPSIPTEEQWQQILTVVREEPLRNRFMFALQYDCALRREELCLLELSDFDFAHRTLRVRVETTKSMADRILVYSETTGLLFREYLTHRSSITRGRGRLFLSESHRNFAAPLSFWSWSKIIRRISESSSVEDFSTHTLRHLRLTDLARSGWELQRIVNFAGHRHTDTTMLYIHLSGRELKEGFKRSMSAIHAWRESTLEELI